MMSINENEIMMSNEETSTTNKISSNETGQHQIETDKIETNAANGQIWTSIKPASRFSISARRECKSTSDEPFVFELNTDTNNNHANSSLISPVNKHGHFFFSNNNNNSKQSPAGASSVKKLLNEDWFLKNIKPKLSNGKFGFNPAKQANGIHRHNTHSYIAAPSSSNSDKKLAHRLNFTQLINPKDTHSQNHNSHHKKQVKRLSYQNNKIFINNNSGAKKHLDYNHNKKLFHAVSNNDPILVTNLLESNMFDVNCFDDKQRTCLHIASSRGYLDIVRLLLQYGSNPNLRDCVNNLPIHLAIIASHVPVVTLLLEAGTDIHTLDLNGNTVLHLAGTRLRWLLNDENNKVSPKLKYEAIMIMNMIKEYLKRKKLDANPDLDMLTNKLENLFNLDDISHITKDILFKFETDFKI